jgi:hypothetical protein
VAVNCLFDVIKTVGHGRIKCNGAGTPNSLRFSRPRVESGQV